jgi:hypothetical protein
MKKNLNKLIIGIWIAILIATYVYFIYYTFSNIDMTRTRIAINNWELICINVILSIGVKIYFTKQNK